MKLINKDKVKQLNPISRRFIGEAILMLTFNIGDNYTLHIYPTTNYAFQMQIDIDNFSIAHKFSAADVKGTNGTFKVAKMISKIMQHKGE